MLRGEARRRSTGGGDGRDKGLTAVSDSLAVKQVKLVTCNLLLSLTDTAASHSIAVKRVKSQL